MNCQCEHKDHFPDIEGQPNGCTGEAKHAISASWKLCDACILADHMTREMDEDYQVEWGTVNIAAASPQDALNIALLLLVHGQAQEFFVNDSNGELVEEITVDTLPPGPQLTRMYRLVTSLIEDRISVLEDEKKDAGNDDDINDQIAHWKAAQTEANAIMTGKK